ncbi:Pyridoxal kinase [Diplonema papillatum]|nr:Pyridoxal kinase [Diplonema papillatum]
MAMPRVLSMQSHVVHGYVGNKCASFPLQLLGVEVDVLNTVHFSNHTGYPSFKGSRLDGSDLRNIVQGLVDNGLAHGYTHLLTGYIGSADLLSSIEDVIKTLRGLNPKLFYTCDPVLGDNGKLYVSPEMLPLFKELIRHADLLTPNQFEAEALSDIKINTIDDAIRVCDHFHAKGVSRVVITSLEVAEYKDTLAIVSSEAHGIRKQKLASITPVTPPEEPQRSIITVPKLDHYFTGTGDLMSALILGWVALEPGLDNAMSKAVGTVQAVIKKTAACIDSACQAAGANALNSSFDSASSKFDPVSPVVNPKSRAMAAKELQLVKARDDIINPPDTFKPRPLTLAPANGGPA